MARIEFTEVSLYQGCSQGFHNKVLPTPWLKETKSCFLTVLQARSPTSRCRQGWLFLSVVRKGSAPSLPSWLIGGHHPPEFLHFIFLCLCLSPKFLLFIRTLIIWVTSVKTLSPNNTTFGVTEG